MKNLKLFLCVLLVSLLAACSSKLLTVHKIDVQQGNALETEMVEKVEIGMTQEQVQYVLGSPLITDSFHPGRWDYIYLFRPGYGEKERRQLTLTFDRGEVIKINKYNIAKSEIASPADDKKKSKAKKKQQEKIKTEAESEKTEAKKSSKEKKEQKELEKQAAGLEEIEHELNTNASPK